MQWKSRLVVIFQWTDLRFQQNDNRHLSFQTSKQPNSNYLAKWLRAAANYT